MDVKLSANQANKVSFLINNTKGDNLTGDRTIDLLSPKMNEVWMMARSCLTIGRWLRAISVSIIIAVMAIMTTNRSGFGEVLMRQ